MKKLLSTTLILSVAFLMNVNAQDFDIPEVEYKGPEDYKKQEATFIQIVDWLEKTPIPDESNLKKYNKRAQANKFVIDWIEGAPNVTVVFSEDMLKPLKKNPHLFVLFMGGWAREVLKDSTLKDNIAAGAKAGFIAAMNCYEKGGAVKKDKKLEKLIAMRNDGTFDAWIDEKFGNMVIKE